MTHADVGRLLDILHADMQHLGLDLVHEQIDHVRCSGGTERSEAIGEAAPGEAELGAKRERTVAVIGPSISQRAYEIGRASCRERVCNDV